MIEMNLEIMFTPNRYSTHIMFISNKDIMNKYFNDLFTWLFKCEKIFGFETLKGYDQTRLYLIYRKISPFWFKKYTKCCNGPGLFLTLRIKTLNLKKFIEDIN